MQAVLLEVDDDGRLTLKAKSGSKWKLVLDRVRGLKPGQIVTVSDADVVASVEDPQMARLATYAKTLHALGRMKTRRTKKAKKPAKKMKRSPKRAAKSATQES